MAPDLEALDHRRARNVRTDACIVRPTERAPRRDAPSHTEEWTPRTNRRRPLPTNLRWKLWASGQATSDLVSLAGCSSARPGPPRRRFVAERGARGRSSRPLRVSGGIAGVNYGLTTSCIDRLSDQKQRVISPNSTGDGCAYRSRRILSRSDVRRYTPGPQACRAPAGNRS